MVNDRRTIIGLQVHVFDVFRLIETLRKIPPAKRAFDDDQLDDYLGRATVGQITSDDLTALVYEGFGQLETIGAALGKPVSFRDMGFCA